MMTPRLDIARAFVTAYLGSPDATVRLCRMPDGKQKFAGDLEGPIDAIWEDVVEAQNAGLGIFFYVNEIAFGPGSGWGGCGKNIDVRAIRALCIDDPKRGIPESWHALPDIVILTSKTVRDGREIQKCQALWRVADCDIDQYKDVQRRLIECYDSDTGVVDLRRVLRMPGTYQLKDPENPQLVTFQRLYEEFGPQYERGLGEVTDELMMHLPLRRTVRKVAKGLPEVEPSRKPVAGRPYDHAAASHPANINLARQAFEAVRDEYRAKGGIHEGGRHHAMFRIAVIPFAYTDDIELVEQWCIEEAFDLLEPGRYEPEDFKREVENAFKKRKMEGTLACRAYPVTLLEQITEVKRATDEDAEREFWNRVIDGSQGAIKRIEKPKNVTFSPADIDRMKQIAAAEQRRSEEWAQRWRTA